MDDRFAQQYYVKRFVLLRAGCDKGKQSLFCHEYLEVMYMQKVLLFFVLLVIFSSCTRDIQENQVLMSHSWYLASTRIIVYDTTTVQAAYNSNAIVPSTVQFTKDTSFIPDPCVTQSTYTFHQNNLLSITNNCMPGSPITDTAWAIFTGNILFMVYIEDTVSDKYISQVLNDVSPVDPPPPALTPANGRFFKITSSQFVVDQTSGELSHSSYYRNNVLIDSFVRIRVEKYATFNSR
jgi:hypothetical protein